MLTRRRLEFLNRIKKLYQETLAPVHYVTVAENLRVSKWTAYDLLRELEKEGFLEREYVVSSGDKLRGRSMIMFVPTEKAYKVTDGEAGGGGTPCGEWQEVRERLLNIFRSWSPREVKGALPELIQELQGKEHRLIAGAYTLTVLLIYLRSLGEKGLAYIRAALEKVARPEWGLALVTGTVLGMAAKDPPQVPFVTQVTRYIHHLQEEMEHFTLREKKLLADFMREALKQN
ncbi:MAG: hypothetical protein IMW96_09350 [Thermoanaerobacteraceae bacterium]|uniref:hypothetical protein n=1 Tax=Thermanaeromonas sp. C210 TaxID=2731925 RepID=UPI00155BC109|nr:hypothetical protein [Thermanaeromonas sp. C210]MBE3581816.1 hypothetical protein [Thermoanaerobacteraceae bacterium]GFN22741.1 hypothetical protein TAMC210_10580 [Thermanaeromonas sp. C210]